MCNISEENVPESLSSELKIKVKFKRYFASREDFGKCSILRKYLISSCVFSSYLINWPVRLRQTLGGNKVKFPHSPVLL